MDLVEWMIRLGLAPESLNVIETYEHKPNGHAIESRVYAEDAYNGFKPSPGKLLAVNFPTSAPHLRIDHWITAGTVVTPNYDAMLAKVMVHGVNREHATERMLAALQNSAIKGVWTNLPHLRAVFKYKYVAGRRDSNQRFFFFFSFSMFAFVLFCT